MFQAFFNHSQFVLLTVLYYMSQTFSLDENALKILTWCSWGSWQPCTETCGYAQRSQFRHCACHRYSTDTEDTLRPGIPFPMEELEVQNTVCYGGSKYLVDERSETCNELPPCQTSPPSMFPETQSVLNNRLVLGVILLACAGVGVALLACFCCRQEQRPSSTAQRQQRQEVTNHNNQTGIAMNSTRSSLDSFNHVSRSDHNEVRQPLQVAPTLPPHHAKSDNNVDEAPPSYAEAMKLN